MIVLLIGEIELYNTFCQKFPFSMFPQETRVLCCLAIPQQVLVATYTTEGLELHAFHFSEHLKLKFEAKELSQLGKLYTLVTFPLIYCLQGFLGKGLGLILDGHLVLTEGKSLNFHM